METLSYIIDKFNIDVKQTSPFYLSIGRFKDIPRLFNELGFKKGAEIGVYRGDYSKWLFRYIPGLTLYGIDTWTIYPGYKDFQKANMDLAYNATLQNTKGYDFKLIKGYSHEVVLDFADESLDFVFIDANHSYEHTVQDISLWDRKVRKGGIVYGHDFDDYSTSKRWKEMHVIDAVMGWIKSYRIHPLFVITKNKNRSWMYIK